MVVSAATSSVAALVGTSHLSLALFALLGGCVAGTISWLTVRTQVEPERDELWLAAIVGPAVVTLAGLPLLFLLPAAVILLGGGFVLGTIAFAVSYVIADARRDSGLKG